MRFTIPLLTFVALFFQACSILPGSYNAGGYSSGYSSSSNQVNYGHIQGPYKAKVELSRISGNDLRFIERRTFTKTIRAQLANSKTITLTSTPDLKLSIFINKYTSNAREYKEDRHGTVIYHLDENYKLQAQYEIRDKTNFAPVKGVTTYNVFVKSKSGIGYDDAKRVAMKRVFEAFAKKVARDIDSRGQILANKYSVRTLDYKSTHNTLCPVP